MAEHEVEKTDQQNETERPTHRVRLPGFLVEEEIGLGDLIKRTTYAMGMKACAGCNRRATKLNRWATFTR